MMQRKLKTDGLEELAQTIDELSDDIRIMLSTRFTEHALVTWLYELMPPAHRDKAQIRAVLTAASNLKSMFLKKSTDIQGDHDA